MVNWRGVWNKALSDFWKILRKPVLKYMYMRGGLMVSALDSGVSVPGSSPGRGHCVVFLGKTLCSHGRSFHPGV